MRCTEGLLIGPDEDRWIDERGGTLVLRREGLLVVDVAVESVVEVGASVESCWESSG